MFDSIINVKLHAKRHSRLVTWCFPQSRKMRISMKGQQPFNCVGQCEVQFRRTIFMLFLTQIKIFVHYGAGKYTNTNLMSRSLSDIAAPRLDLSHKQGRMLQYCRCDVI